MISTLPRRRLVGLLLAWIAALVVVAWLVAQGRQVAVERAERGTAALAAVMEQQVERTFQALYLTLGAVADAEHLTKDTEFQQMLSRRLKELPFARALFIIGPDGWITHDTDYPRTPAVSLADREYFRAYREDPARSATIWPPLLSRSGTGWFLPVTRQLGSAEKFEGVVVAALQAAHFEEQFKAAGLPHDYLVTLLHIDGTLVASYPALREDVGKNYRHLPMFTRIQERNFDTYWTAGGLLPGERVVSYRVTAGAPFVVRVSRGADTLLAEWRRMATATGLAMLGLTLLVAWMTILLARDASRRALQRDRRMQTEKLEALGQLSASMAHDFANLLNVAGTSAAILRANSGNRAIEEHAIDSLERTVRAGHHVSNRLLSFARRKALALERVRLDAWLEVARPLFAQAAGSHVELDVQSTPGLPEILCDTGELDVALINLLVNARDAMAGSGRISVRAFPCDDENGVPQAIVAGPPKYVCLTVRDNGPGMSKVVRQRALEPYFTTKGEAGTGLGLSQVYGFMQQLGGQLTIDSKVGHGTAIHLFFPVAPPAPNPER